MQTNQRLRRAEGLDVVELRHIVRIAVTPELFSEATS